MPPPVENLQDAAPRLENRTPPRRAVTASVRSPAGPSDGYGSLRAVAGGGLEALGSGRAVVVVDEPAEHVDALDRACVRRDLLGRYGDPRGLSGPPRNYIDVILLEVRRGAVRFCVIERGGPMASVSPFQIELTGQQRRELEQRARAYTDPYCQVVRPRSS